MPAGLYKKLVGALSIPQKQKVLFHTEIISSEMLEVLDLLPEPCISRQLLDAIRTADDARKLCYCIEAILTFVPPADQGRIWASASRITSSRHISRWFHRWLEEAPLTMPPWQGSRLLQPINTAGQLLSAARSFENCLAMYLFRAISGEVAFYLWAGQESAVVGVRRDPFFGWSMSRMEGRPHQRALSPATRAEILEEFRKANFRVESIPTEGDLFELELGL